MPCQINNTSNFDITEIEDLIQDLFSFSQDRLGFKENPCLNLVSDEKNVSPLGKTAYYDPNDMQITIYVDGRHPKDIMRSFSHELVHHNQNESGMFDQMNNTGTGYAQSDPHLRKMEKEAYLKGNMCFRDWEDGYKSSNPNILNERRIYKMSTKKWKEKELNGLLNEKWGFSMDLNKLNENKKPDYIDIDGDGDKKEPMAKAAKDKKKLKKEDMFGSDDEDDEQDEAGGQEEETIEEIKMGVSGGLGKTPKKETNAAKQQSDKNYAHMKKQRDNKTTVMKEEDKEMGANPEGVTELMDAINGLSEKESEEIYRMLLNKHQKKDPTQAVKEAKLRKAITKIIKSKFNK